MGPSGAFLQKTLAFILKLPVTSRGAAAADPTQIPLTTLGKNPRAIVTVWDLSWWPERAVQGGPRGGIDRSDSREMLWALLSSKELEPPYTGQQERVPNPPGGPSKQHEPLGK